MKMKWKDATASHKIVTACSIVVNLAVVVLAILQMFEIWTHAVNLCVPLMGVSMLCQAYLQWNNSRKVAWFSVGTAVFIFACAIAVFFIK